MGDAFKVDTESLPRAAHTLEKAATDAAADARGFGGGSDVPAAAYNNAPVPAPRPDVPPPFNIVTPLGELVEGPYNRVREKMQVALAEAVERLDRCGATLRETVEVYREEEDVTLADLRRIERDLDREA